MIKIDVIEVHGVKDRGDKAVIVPDDDADFFGLYGLVQGEVNGFYIAIGDYANRADAELAKELLDNKSKGTPPQ